MPRAPSLDDLARFRKVTEKGSFAAAARDLGVPKSTLSKAIARLEDDLGVRLLERTTRNMRPTEIGRVVAAHGKDMLDAFEAARLAAASTDGPAGRIRVSCPPGLLESLADEVVLRVLQAFPKVDIELRITAEQVDLIRDDIDIALRAREKVDAGAAFVVRRLGQSRGTIVATPGLLEDLGPVEAPRDLARLPTLALAGDSIEWKLFDAEGAAHVVPIAPRLVTSNVETLKKAALRGVGLAQLPEHACGDDVAEGRLVRVLTDYSTVEGTIYAVFSRESARAPALRAFIDQLVVGFGRLAPVAGQRPPDAAGGG